MSSAADRSAEYHLLYQVINAPLRAYPFPHLYIENAFPDAFYHAMLAAFPAAERMKPIAQERGLPATMYPSRFMLALEPGKIAELGEAERGIWARLGAFLAGPNFAETVLWKFADVVKQRFAGRGGVAFRSEAMLVDDRENYVLGPHSDNPKKVVTLLFYLADDDSRPELGTSIYVPNDPGFRCPGGPEYPFERFQRVMTMPYRPNALFAFPKTDNSFHGVEPVSALISRRKLMLFDVYLRPAAAAPAADAPAPGAKVTFSM